MKKEDKYSGRLIQRDYRNRIISDKLIGDVFDPVKKRWKNGGQISPQTVQRIFVQEHNWDKGKFEIIKNGAK